MNKEKKKRRGNGFGRPFPSASSRIIVIRCVYNYILQRHNDQPLLKRPAIRAGFFISHKEVLEVAKMSEAARKAKAVYMKQWRDKNKEKQQEYTNRYWEKRAAKMGYK